MRRALVAASLVVIVSAACSSSANPRAARLSDDDAARLSQVLARNYDGRGATFTATLTVRAGTTLGLQGEVDWAGHRGRADVTWIGNPAPGRVVEAAWSGDTIAERLPTLAQALTDAGRPAANWVGRPADPQNDILDRVAQFVAKLSATQRDNPVLVQQDPRAAWLRAEKLEGAAVDVYRYGDGLTLWVGADGRLRRVEGGLAGFAGPLVVRFLTAGEQQVLGPRSVDVVLIDDVRAVYDRLNPAPR